MKPALPLCTKKPMRAGCNQLACKLLRRIIIGAVVTIHLGVTAIGEDAVEVFAIETWSIDRGLPQNSINALLQSRDGYLWLGTYNGVVRFDGVRFTVFDSANTPVMRNSRVTSLFEDSRGSLWIGHETGELTRLTEGVFEPVDLSPHWVGGIVQSIGEDEVGDIWILNAEGSVLRLRDGLMLDRFAGVGQEPGGTPEMTKDQAGRLLVSRNGSVAMIQNGRWSPLQFDDATAYYSRACRAPAGGLWVAGPTSITRWDQDRWVQTAGSMPAGVSYMPTLMQSRSGRVLAGSIGHGLLVFEPDGRRLIISIAEGLPHVWVKCIVEDREGNIWVGTRGGLSVLRRRKVVMHSPPDGWQNVLPLAIAPSVTGPVWAGSEGAGLYRFDGRAWRRYGNAEGLSNSYIWSVLEDSTGSLWAGTWSGGLFRGRDDQFSVPRELQDLKAPIMALMESPAGTLWIGTGKGLARFKDGQFERFAALGGAAAGDIRALAAGNQGEIWLGTLGAGLGRFADGKLAGWTARDGLAGDFVLSLHPDADGTIWIGTLERGLCRFKDGRFSVIDTKHGLPSNIIGHIADDGQGKLWFNSSQGIFSASKTDLNRVADNSGQEQLTCLLYGISAGLPSLAGSAGFTPSGFHAENGRIWFPTAKGLAVINPAEVATNHLPPPIAIEEVSIGGHPVGLASLRLQNDPLQVPPGSQQIEIRFTALSFSAPERVQFKWRLEGFEGRWSIPQTQRSATYSYLPPGKYTFQVTACNNDGVWNVTPAILRVVVLPFLWETWWFKTALTLVILLLFGSSIVAVQRARARRKLERAARERALEQERARIAQDIHDDLGASLTRIGMLSQTARETLDDAPGTARYLGQIYNAAREMTRSMDEIVWAVNPRHDTLESLFNYLTRFAHEFLTPARIRCRLHVPVEFSERAVRSEIRHNLFLAFKEALHNTVRHSGADEVQISITLQGDVLKVVVSDNGRGRTANPAERPDRITAGHGLANIQSRLARIGGHSQITSAPGQGLCVELQTPLRGMVRS